MRDSHASLNSKITKEPEKPVRLELEEDKDRPEDEGMEKEDIEYMIERKRIRVITEARNKAEKAKQ